MSLLSRLFGMGRDDKRHLELATPAPNPDKELTGSARALGRLFSMPQFLPHSVSFRPSRAKRKEARQRRLDNWTRSLRRGFAAAALERLQCDCPLGCNPGCHRIKAANARKRERQFAR